MQNRIDIINNLPPKSVAHLARKYNVTHKYINDVLEGKKKKRTASIEAVINDAQIIAAVHIWNERFNKVAPNINPLTVV